MISVERLRYWQGQLLKSRDFRDQLRYQGQLRAWHNAALHQAFGIVTGLEIVDGEVTCGFGYDCLGREIILPKDSPLPARAGSGAQLLAALPATAGAASSLAWVDELEWSAKSGLPLGRVTGPGTNFDPNYGTAPFVRPIARPRLASGETVRGNTPWDLWIESGAPVGVLTHVDTSAAGFTETPHYFATLKAAAWPLAPTAGKKAVEFAPAYFAHVSDVTSAGFTFRLLLQDVALRRFELADDVARITKLARGNAVVFATVEPASAFQKGDALVQVRPRADVGASITKAEGKTLTVTATLDLTKNDRVVLGNLPRTASVKQVTQEADVFVTLASLSGTLPGSILARFDADPAKARASRVERIKDGKILLRDPWPGLAEGEHVQLFHRKDAIKLSDAKTEGDTTTISVPSDAGLKTGDLILHPTRKTPEPPSLVTGVTTAGDTSSVTLKPSIVELKAGVSVIPSRAESSVSGVDTPTGSLEIEFDDDAPFVEQDYIKPVGSLGPAAMVDFVDGPIVRVRAPASWTTAKDVLVAGNITGGLTVESTRVQQGVTIVQVARPTAVRTGDAVARTESDTTLSAPAAVTRMPGSEFSIDPAIPGLTRMQRLVVIQFPAVVRVAATAFDNQIRVDPIGLLAAGDWIAPLDAESSFPTVQVTAVNADGSLSLSQPIDVAVDSQLGQANFREIGVVNSVDPTKKEIETMDALEGAGDSDFIGRWSYYADNASPVVVSDVAGGKLTLQALPGGDIAGEGMLPSGPFDAGLLAYASISAQQGRTVLKQPSGLKAGDTVTLSGTDASGASLTIPVKATPADQTRLTLEPTLGVSYSLRPERARLVSKFNQDFPTSFAVFAQRQGLYVAWLGCQGEPRTLPECGSQQQEDPCL